MQSAAWTRGNLITSSLFIRPPELIEQMPEAKPVRQAEESADARPGGRRHIIGGNHCQQSRGLRERGRAESAGRKIAKVFSSATA